MSDPILRGLLATQSIALLVAAGNWGRVWHCPCEPTLQDAAFWTAVTIAQTVIVTGVAMLRSR